MALLLKPSDDPAEVWLDLFREAMPEMEVRVWPDCGAPEDIEFALVQRPPPGALARFPNLRFVASITAGVERLLEPDVVPENLPLVRCISPVRAGEMSEYVLMQALRFHRQVPLLESIIRQGGWWKPEQPDVSERRCGVMGLGELGGAAARRLAGFGFATAGWSRTPHGINGVETFSGADGFEAFLARTDILVCLLPLTGETRGILNADTFAKLPAGAYVINVARGAHLIEDDLIAAMDSGHIAGCSLDVLSVEPPPSDLPILNHPKAYVTPHISCRSRAGQLMDGLLDNMRRARAGEPLLNLVDRTVGY